MEDKTKKKKIIKRIIIIVVIVILLILGTMWLRKEVIEWVDSMLTGGPLPPITGVP